MPTKALVPVKIDFFRWRSRNDECSATRVSFGSFSTELGCRRHVRFTPGRDRWGGHPGSAASCHKQAHTARDDYTYQLACWSSVHGSCRNSLDDPI
jgi:hypothetical protein